MKKLLRIIKKIAMKLGLNVQISRITKIEEIKKFIKKLRPQKTNIELIRVGSKEDGGYLLPNDLEGIEALFSPGVGMKSDFELDCANRGIKIFMADASVEKPCQDHELFNFQKKFISSFDNEEFTSIEEWVNESGLSDNTDLMLQMDIESSEYEAIYSIPKSIMKRFRIIIIEFHELDMLWNRALFQRVSHAFDKLLETHYVVHIHPNNCCEVYKKYDLEIPKVMEFTFIRKDRVEIEGFVDTFPHILDVDCAKNESLVLPKCWYKSYEL